MWACLGAAWPALQQDERQGLLEGRWAQEDMAESLWNMGWANGTRPVSDKPTTDRQGPEVSRFADVLFSEALGA